MEYGTTNQTKSVFWNWVKQHDNILWMGLFLIVCACLVVGCSPAVGNPQNVVSQESTTDEIMNEVIDPVGESTAVQAQTETESETETETPSLTQDPLSVPTYSDTTYPYYVEELDVTLDIPEGMYVYRTDSIRRHYDGSRFRLDCCEWILVTDKEYEQSYVDEGLMADLEKEAKHLVFGLVLAERELVPVARLFPGVVLCSRPERVTENWYCEILHDATWLMTQDGGYKKLSAEECARWSDTKLSAQLEQKIQEKTMGTDSLNQEGDYLLKADLTAEYSYQNTMLNPYWWRGYCYAVEELTEHPENYVYDGEDATAIRGLMESLRETASNYWHDGQTITDIYIDQAEDIYLRAYYYANSYAYYMGDEELTIPLKDIIVGLQDWNNSQRSYTIRWADGSFFYSMSDHMVDLQPSYQYLLNKDLLPVGKKEILSIPVGDGEGEVGYFVVRHEGPGFVLTGPDDFVVEDGKITVLDTVNQRLLMFEDGKYIGGFVVDACEAGGWLYHQKDQWIIVSSINSQVGSIYREDGSHVTNVSYASVEPYMDELHGPRKKLPNWMASEGNRLIDVLGVGETSVLVGDQNETRCVYYYEQMDFLEVPKFLASRCICKAQEYGPAYYTMLDHSEGVYFPLNSFYLDEDGTVYLMECLEDRVVISEVLWEFINVYSGAMWSGWSK